MERQTQQTCSFSLVVNESRDIQEGRGQDLASVVDPDHAGLRHDEEPPGAVPCMGHDHGAGEARGYSLEDQVRRRRRSRQNCHHRENTHR